MSHHAQARPRRSGLTEARSEATMSHHPHHAHGQEVGHMIHSLIGWLMVDAH